jgi:hypothetical protein
MATLLTTVGLVSGPGRKDARSADGMRQKGEWMNVIFIKSKASL